MTLKSLVTFNYMHVIATYLIFQVNPQSTLFDVYCLSAMGFPTGSAGKEFACNEGDLGSVPDLGRSPGEGKGSPFQYSGLENFMACIVHGVAKSRTWLSTFHFQFVCACSVDQLCLTLGGPVDCSPTGSSVRGIFQARVLQWVAISFSRGSSRSRDRTQVSCIAGRRFTVWATREAREECCIIGFRKGKMI